MEVILLERIAKLGQMGDIVRVRPGYARNYLLPQKKALRATAENREYFQHQRAQLEAVNLKRREEAASVAERMQDVRITLLRQAGDSGQLYGSVSARDIAEGLDQAGYTVGRNQIDIDRPIKSLGLFEVQVALHPEIRVPVTVNVARSAEEAEMQEKLGGMVTGEMIERQIAAEEAAQAEAERAAEEAAEAAEAELAAAESEEQPAESMR